MTLQQWLLDGTPEQLAIDSSKSELETPDHDQTLMEINNPIHEFVIPPLTNL
jgi:hypothetical protein